MEPRDLRRRWTAALLVAAFSIALALWWTTRPRSTRDASSAPNGAPAASAAPAARSPDEAPAQPLSGNPEPTHETRVPQSAVALFVSVSGAGGQVVRSGQLMIQDSRGTQRVASLDGQREYRFQDLPAGPLVVSVTETIGYLPYHAALELQGDSRHDVLLQPTTKLGVRFLSPRGERLAMLDELPRPWFEGSHLVAIATEQSRGARLLGAAPVSGMVFEAGRYVDDAPPPTGEGELSFDGTLELLRPAPLFASAVLGETVLATERIELPRTAIDFVIDPARVAAAYGSLSFRAVDGASGEPPSGKHGYMVARKGHAGPVGLVAFDSQGRGQLELLPPGECVLVIEVVGYAFERRVARIDSGRETDLGDILLTPGALLTGTIVDEQGQPVDAQVWCSDLRGEHASLGRASNLGEGHESEFALASLPRSDLALGVDGADWARNAVVVSPRSGSARDIVLVARRGTAVTIEIPNGGPAPVLMRVLDDRGVAAWVQDAWPDGRTLAARLLPGKYELVTRLGSGEEVRRSFDVATEPLHLPAGP